MKIHPKTEPRGFQRIVLSAKVLLVFFLEDFVTYCIRSVSSLTSSWRCFSLRFAYVHIGMTNYIGMEWITHFHHANNVFRHNYSWTNLAWRSNGWWNDTLHASRSNTIPWRVCANTLFVRNSWMLLVACYYFVDVCGFCCWRCHSKPFVNRLSVSAAPVFHMKFGQTHTKLSRNNK